MRRHVGFGAGATLFIAVALLALGTFVTAESFIGNCLFEKNWLRGSEE
jgi:hypothetical protein